MVYVEKIFRFDWRFWKLSTFIWPYCYNSHLKDNNHRSLTVFIHNYWKTTSGKILTFMAARTWNMAFIQKTWTSSAWKKLFRAKNWKQYKYALNFVWFGRLLSFGCYGRWLKIILNSVHSFVETLCEPYRPNRSVVGPRSMLSSRAPGLQRHHF